MEVILNQDVKGLGYKYDIVKVKAGYGRNYLIPRGIALLATESNKKVQAETLKQRAYKEDKLRKEAAVNVEKLAGITLKIGAKAGESGKIFGSVTTVQIAKGIREQPADQRRKHRRQAHGHDHHCHHAGRPGAAVHVEDDGARQHDPGGAGARLYGSAADQDPNVGREQTDDAPHHEQRGSLDGHRTAAPSVGP